MTQASIATIARWHEILRSGQLDDLTGLMADGIVFRSPAFHSPYPGKAAALHILKTVFSVFEEFVYHREFWTDGGKAVALEFTASVEGKKLKGLDLITFDDDGLMVEFEVLIRPANALMALGEVMSRRAGPELLRMKAAGGQ